MKMKLNLPAPRAKKEAKLLEIHGDQRVDNYFWLNQRENPEVLKYLEEENKYTRDTMAPLALFQDELFLEMKSRIKESDMSVPYFSDGWFYYARFEEGKEYPVYCRKKETLESDEDIMLDVNELAEGFEYFQVKGLAISPNKKYLAYGVDTLSRRIYTIYIKDLVNGKLLDIKLENSSGSSAWANDNKTLFYTQKEKDTLREFQIWRTDIGGGGQGEMIYEEEDGAFSCYAYKSKSREFIMIGSSSSTSSEYRFLNANDPNGDFQLVQKREKDHEYGVGHKGDFFYVVTNWNAKNFRLMKTPLRQPSKSHWEELVPHREDVLLEDIELFNDYLVLEERIKGIVQLRVIDLKKDEEHCIDFGEEAFSASCGTNLEFDSHTLRIGYTSLTTPNSVFDYDMITRELSLLKEQEVLGEFDRENYQSERLYVKARDGVQVPMSLVYHKETEIDGTAPTLLYGYGSYGHSIDPYFSSVRLSLLDRGFVFAIAHIRGSETLGRSWYEDGKLMNKKNTFYDFIDCGKYLVNNSYSATDLLFAMGGSAGGLLMGAVINMAPELWKGVVAQVPFVDVVTTMLDEEIPLTIGEFDEWGNPKEKEYYDYIKSYSPYDNVESKEYPNLLVTTGLHDSQVQYWEPAKWVAKLRELKTDDNILLLHTEMDFGHGGASGRFQALKEIALEYAFVLDLAGRGK